MEICSHPMVPKAPLFYFPGGTTAALRLPPSPLRMRGMDGPPPPMKSRLTETAPLPSAAAAPEFTPDDDSFLEEFLVDDYIVLDGAESPCKEAPEEAGKGVAFPADLSSAVPAEPQPLLEINLPEHDPTEFEWVSLVIDESLHPPSPGVFPCRLATPTKLQPRIQPPEKRRALVLQPPQPVESEPPHRILNPNLAREAYPNFSRDGHLPIKAKRSKRPRNESRRPDSASSAVYSPSSSSSSGSGSGSGSYNSFPPYRQSVFFDEGSLPREKPKKKRGRKPRLPGGAGSSSAVMAERRCTHCGSQKTPQWRTGPNGPKTLCNACGVRFKSGRLMPEYRPAASPTFDSHVHANSHRKVLEMRRKKEQRHGDASTPVDSF